MPHTYERYLAVADAIGAQLCRDALWVGQRCNWLGASMEVVGGTWQPVQRTFGPDFYNGTSGIALFLGRLYRLMNERIYRMTALGAIRQAISRLDDISPMAQGSFYLGLTGVAYTCTMLASLLDEASLLDQGLSLLDQLPDVDATTQGQDVLSGCAGSIPVLLHLGREHNRQDMIELAIHYGQHLLDTARRWTFGLSWNTLQLSEQPELSQRDLLGFSHGAAGVAWSLLELYQETKQDQFRQGAEQGFQYERHWFSPQQRNWPDFRGFQGLGHTIQEPGFMIAWCHGAPGIGLSRLRAYELLRDETYRQEAEIAIHTTAAALEQSLLGSASSFCLCHGLAGNADLLLYGAHILNNSHYLALAEQVGQYGAERYDATQTPWPCGILDAGETPGLFLGLAGIGYFYLRLHDRVNVPPITILLPGEVRRP